MGFDPLFLVGRRQVLHIINPRVAHGVSVLSHLAPRTETKGRDAQWLLMRAVSLLKTLEAITVAVPSLKSQKIN